VQVGEVAVNINLGISRRRFGAFNLVELLVVIAVVAVMVGMLLPARHRPVKAERIKCVNNLKNIGLSFRIFATDHQDRFPFEVPVNEGGSSNEVSSGTVYLHFLVMSNELSTPKLLSCPADRKRKPARSFAELQNVNVSYFVGLNASEKEPQTFLAGDRNLTTNGQPVGPGLIELTPDLKVGWTKEIHNLQGNVAMGDGSVQQFPVPRLADALRSKGTGTNRLAVP
jgi:prepilin-type processing-associated H-X9-DG protein